MEYGKAQTFSLLSLFFPFVDLQQHNHIDHVFPKSGFKKKNLRKAELSEDEIEVCLDRRDRVANLQLLEGHANIEKQDRLPAEWLGVMFADADSRRAYCERHLLGDTMDGWASFLDFYEARREALRGKLHELLSPGNSSRRDEESVDA